MDLMGKFMFKDILFIGGRCGAVAISLQNLIIIVIWINTFK